ncbi:MAG: hypothetical protein ABI968_03180 [Acidobacteriota bacterium]
MTQPIITPAKTSRATATRNAIPIARHEMAVIAVPLWAIPRRLREP